MSDQVKQCNKCNKIFHSFANNRICPECTEQADRDFIKVREYIYEHPQATVQTVSEKTEVDEKEILRMLKEGRLILETASDLLTCERCLRPLHSGRLCDECKESLSQVLSNAVDKPKQTEKTPSYGEQDQGLGMHINVRKK